MDTYLCKSYDPVYVRKRNLDHYNEKLRNNPDLYNKKNPSFFMNEKKIPRRPIISQKAKITAKRKLSKKKRKIKKIRGKVKK